MGDRATETMALPKPPVWLPSSCHWIRNAVNSAVLSIPSSDPEQWLWDGSTCAFNLLFSRKYKQKMDRERSKQFLCLPSPHQIRWSPSTFQRMLQGTQPADTLLHTRLCLDNNPLASMLPSAKGGRLCIKGSVLKREEYFPMKNQHPHKTKS